MVEGKREVERALYSVALADLSPDYGYNHVSTLTKASYDSLGVTHESFTAFYKFK